MIAWSGVVFFVAVLISAVWLLCKWLLDIYYYDGFFVVHLWATGAALIVSALFCAASSGCSGRKNGWTPLQKQRKASQ